MEAYKPLSFQADTLVLLDQRRLPQRVTYFKATSYRDVFFSIREMIIRGAPAIGLAAAYGVYLGALQFKDLPEELFMEKMEEVFSYLKKSRPTAFNLYFALNRMKKRLISLTGEAREQLLKGLFEEAYGMEEENKELNKRLAAYGNEIVPQKATILTHCNTGSLATAFYGTALGVIREAFFRKKDIKVYANETRPRLQGAQLTVWELLQDKLPVTLLVDSASATLIRDKKVDLILVGADSIASNGDVANKVGTFMLSVLAKEYQVPFYSVAPMTTFDFSIEGGEGIIIEERDSQEVTHIHGHLVAPLGVHVYNPAFDVTPAKNITGIITDQGIVYPPFKENIASLRKEEGHHREMG